MQPAMMLEPKTRFADLHACLPTLGTDNVQTGAARVELGGLLLREHRYKQAEAELLAGYRIVTPGRAPSLQAAVEARVSLTSLYQALDEPE